MIVFSLVRVARDHVVVRNTILLIASYVFYGWWDIRFLALLGVSTVVDFLIARLMGQCEEDWKRRGLLLVSLCVNLGLLALFKYFEFFIDSFAELFKILGWRLDYASIQIILPVGISFYTFQTLSYTIDVYRKELRPTRSLLEFAVYVSFFPQLVAGPIERASHFLPQLHQRQRVSTSDYSVAIWLISLGYFKKVFIADNLAGSIDPIFANYAGYSSWEIWLAVIGFAFQIYCDFSGYSDIARGLARSMGFDLCLNFCLPLFASGPQDFWRRWHISLSTWLRDYVYIPLGGSRGSRWFTARNLMTTMVLGGLWHGASWNFVLWGVFHGLILTVERWIKTSILAGILSRCLFFAPSLLLAALTTSVFFGIMLVGWLLFRADSLQIAFEMATRQEWALSASVIKLAAKILFYSFPLLLLEFSMLRRGDLFFPLKLSLWEQSFFLVGMWWAVLSLGYHGETSFLYFQF